MGVRWMLLLLFACSSGTPKAAEDATHVVKAPSDAAIAIDATPARPVTGDAQIRVSWPKVTSVLRASPGATACKTPRTPFVAPSTTFGIGDVFVIVDGAPAPAEAHVRLADCALAPRVAVGGTLVVESAADRPAALTLRKRGDLGKVEALVAGTAVPIQLPVAGHAVQTVLEPDGVYELVADKESAWIVAGHAAITDGNGVVLIKDLAPGVHAVTAWLPPRAGQVARRATGSITVEAGDLAELALSFE